MAAANARARVVVDYGPDPADRYARGLLADTLARVMGRLVHGYGADDFNPSTTYHGQDDRRLQNFAGAAHGGATSVVTRDGGHADMSSGIAEGPMGDPARRIFADRLRRRTAL